jgi:DUF2911 family protein
MTGFRRLFLVAIALTLISIVAQTGLAHGAERAQAKATIGGAHVTVDYGRPLLKGRDPLNLLKPGQVWRIGADASTTIESDKDLNFGGTKVPKGKHILLAQLVEPGKWALVVSSKPWNQYEPGSKIAETPLALADAPDPVETVTIQLSEKDGAGVIEISWGKMRLSGTFKAE